jgi:SAM-dependent methyltransferase
LSTSETLIDLVKRHYSPIADLGSHILESLTVAGIDISRLTIEDLSFIDEFHNRGRDATVDLARAIGLDASKHVLDIGSGIGGPSRFIAQIYGCRVTGIDLVDEYCQVATMLADRVGLSDLVGYCQGDALNLPFPDASFDVVWSQHTAMNVFDKAAFYREAARVLKYGGILAINDVLSGPVGHPYFPLPWAITAESGFLIEPAELHSLLRSNRLSIVEWEDKTDSANAWSKSAGRQGRQAGSPRLGIEVLLGPEGISMARNMKRSIEENRVVIVQVVAAKTMR